MRVWASIGSILLLMSFFFFGLTLAAPKDAGLYFDLGARSKEKLTPQARSSLIRIIDLRIHILTQRLTKTYALQSDVKKEIHKLVKARSEAVYTTGAVFGVMATAASWLIVQYLYPGLIPTLSNSRSLLFPAFILSTSSFMIWGSLAAAIRSLRHSPSTERALTLSDRRSKELVEAAEDLSEQIKMMALPIEWWSVRRLQDFTLRMLGLAELETVVVERTPEVQERVKRAMKLAGLGQLSDLEGMADETEAKLTQSELSGLQRIRGIQLETLRNLREILIRQTESRVVKIANPQQAMQSCLKSLEAIVGGGESFDY